MDDRKCYGYSCFQKKNIRVVCEEEVYDSLNNKHSEKCFSFNKRVLDIFTKTEIFSGLNLNNKQNKKLNFVVDKLFHSSLPSLLQQKTELKKPAVLTP